MSVRYQPPSQLAREWIETALGPNAKVLAVSRLSGGLTAAMDRVRIRADGMEFEVVLRRWSHHEWGAGLVEREAAGLDALVGNDLPVPALLAYDQSGELAGEPCLLMTALPGRPMLSPADVTGYVDQLATMLVRIHEIVPAGLAATDPHGFDEQRVDGWIRDPALAKVVKEAAAGQASRSRQIERVEAVLRTAAV